LVLTRKLFDCYNYNVGAFQHQRMKGGDKDELRETVVHWRTGCRHRNTNAGCNHCGCRNRSPCRVQIMQLIPIPNIATVSWEGYNCVGGWRPCIVDHQLGQWTIEGPLHIIVGPDGTDRGIDIAGWCMASDKSWPRRSVSVAYEEVDAWFSSQKLRGQSLMMRGLHKNNLTAEGDKYHLWKDVIDNESRRNLPCFSSWNQSLEGLDKSCRWSTADGTGKYRFNSYWKWLPCSIERFVQQSDVIIYFSCRYREHLSEDCGDFRYHRNVFQCVAFSTTMQTSW
jgi:hypothetical protein